MDAMPALSLAAVPGRRLRTLELIGEIEKRGFSGIYGPSLSDVMGLCVSIAHLTERVTFGPTILPIYLRHPSDLGNAAVYLHEISGGRFRLGLGVSHGPAHQRLGVTVGKPLSDMRAYVEKLKAGAEQSGPLPPIVLATLRDKMVDLAVEVADGAVWANGARSYMKHSLAKVPDGFFVANMVPTVIDDDEKAAAAVCRKTLTGYVALPNYRNYWKAAGYVEEMEAVEKALEAGQRDRIPEALSDKWLNDVTLFGPVGKVRDGVEAWIDAGVTTPILVPSSTKGGQMVAIDEIFAAFA